MARLTNTPAAKAVRRDIFPLSLTALATVLLLAFMANQAWAQKGPGPAGPAGGSVNLIEDSLDLCALLSGDRGDAESELQAQGWSIDYSDSNSSYVWEVDASKTYADGSYASIFALMETYPTGQITYCSFTADSVPNVPDLNTVQQVYDVTGEVQPFDGGADGTWEQVNDGVTYYALASVSEGYYYMQLTAVAQGGLNAAPQSGPVGKQ